MASTYKIARMIVEEFEATEDYRSEDYARIMERVERAVRERYPDVTGEQWAEEEAQRTNYLLEPPT